MTPPGLGPGEPATALLALVLGVLAVRKAYQHSRRAAMLTFMAVSAVFAATVLFIAINGWPR